MEGEKRDSWIAMRDLDCAVLVSRLCVICLRDLVTKQQRKESSITETSLAPGPIVKPYSCPVSKHFHRQREKNPLFGNSIIQLF